MIHMTLRKKTLWFLGALSFFASLAATFAVFWLNRNDSSPAEWNFNPIWTKAEKEQILTVANFTAHRSPERFIYRGLSLNSRHIDWHMFSEVSMRQYMKDEIRERLQMIRDTAESADGRCITPSHETLLHLAAGLGEVQLLNRLLQRHADPNVQIILPQQAFPSIPDSEQGNTPLTYACQPGMDDSTPLPVHNRISCLNLLIQYGADVNKPGPLGWPPLVITCVAGIGGAPYEEAALFLLKCGADISLQPELKGKKTSLLTWATAAGYPLLVRKLCEAGYDPNFRGEMVPPLLSLNLNTPNTALQIAHILLEYGADVNAAMPASTTLPETTGDTALLRNVAGRRFPGPAETGYCASSAGPPRRPLPERQIRTHSPPADRQPVKRTSPNGAEIPAGIERSAASEEGKPLNTAVYFTRAFTVSSRMPASGWEPVLMK